MSHISHVQNLLGDEIFSAVFYRGRAEVNVAEQSW